MSFLDADAPWHTPHQHTINVIDSSSGKVACVFVMVHMSGDRLRLSLCVCDNT